MWMIDWMLKCVQVREDDHYCKCCLMVAVDFAVAVVVVVVVVVVVQLDSLVHMTELMASTSKLPQLQWMKV